MTGHLTPLLGDDRVARHAAAGDRQALEEIYRRYHQPLYRFCLAMVGNPSDAQDALQNTMVKVLRALPGETRQIALKPWLYRIARNEAVETLRHRVDQVEPEQEQIASPLEIAETAADRERLRRLFADIRELPERQRGALVMRELSGLGFDEIAKALQTSPATARQTVYEARLGLRQMEAGREMSCEAVARALSDGDGRAAWRRDLRAHLRDCVSCRAFRDEIAERQGAFAAIAPLPLAASTYLLHGVLGGSTSGAGGAGAGGAIGSGAGQVAATSTIVKSVAVIAAATAVGVTSADRTGLIDLHLPADDQRAARSHSEGGGTDGSQSGGKTGTSAAAQARRNGRRADAHGPTGSGGSRAAAADSGTAGTGSGSQGRAGRTGSSAAGEPAASGSEGAASHGPSSSTSGSTASSHGNGHAHDGGHGGGADLKGPPSGLPEAAGHGQGTAAAHKPPQANPSPGPGSQGKGGPPSTPPGGGGPPEAPAPPASPEPPAQGGGGAPPGPPSPPGKGEPPAGPTAPQGGGPP